MLDVPGQWTSPRHPVPGAQLLRRLPNTRRNVRHLKILEERPGNALGNVAAAKALLRWSATEREAWLDAVINDPLLPGRILPSDYLGQRERWPSAKADGGWKCSGPPTGNSALSTLQKPAQAARDAGQPFVAYVT